MAKTVAYVYDPIHIRLDNIELKSYVRMTRRSMFVNKYAKAYVEQQRELRKGITETLEALNLPKFKGDLFVPELTPFGIRISVFTVKPLHKCDLDNLIKAALDLCQRAVFKNDAWCDSIAGDRYQLGKDEIPYTDIVIYQKESV